MCTRPMSVCVPSSPLLPTGTRRCSAAAAGGAEGLSRTRTAHAPPRRLVVCVWGVGRTTAGSRTPRTILWGWHATSRRWASCSIQPRPVLSSRCVTPPPAQHRCTPRANSLRWMCVWVCVGCVRLELQSIEVTGPSTIEANWTLGGTLLLPWHPTIQRFDGA